MGGCAGGQATIRHTCRPRKIGWLNSKAGDREKEGERGARGLTLSLSHDTDAWCMLVCAGQHHAL